MPDGRGDPEGILFQIQRWSLHDGNGMVTVFLHERKTR